MKLSNEKYPIFCVPRLLTSGRTDVILGRICCKVGRLRVWGTDSASPPQELELKAVLSYFPDHYSLWTSWAISDGLLNLKTGEVSGGRGFAPQIPQNTVPLHNDEPSGARIQGSSSGANISSQGTSFDGQVCRCVVSGFLFHFHRKLLNWDSHCGNAMSPAD